MATMLKPNMLVCIFEFTSKLVYKIRHGANHHPGVLYGNYMVTGL